MKKVIAVCFVGFSLLGSTAPRASAWWTLDSHRCCAKICCKQYNAFSPFCCQGAAGNFPLPGYGYGGWPASAFPMSDGYLGQLPALEPNGAPVTNGSAAPPASNNGSSPSSSNPSSSVAVPSQDSQPLAAGAPPRPLPVWGTGVMHPMAPAYAPGFPIAGPMNGTPTYYPGLPISGPVNGSPIYYPSFPSYGPANGFGR